ncbi:hypothetical protein [Pigmentiphaga sp.]|uniref:hypothetical protein n=1 Tax=Pigmentiphaga sp. TaxID=1977564 RepID=UPI0025E06112|nr:hypothetical protein [Pigmentiphaga sp.]
MAVPIALPLFQAFDASGAPLAGGKLHTYKTGTLVSATTYQDQSGTLPNPNPVILDARGEARIYLQPNQAYSFTLKDSADVLVWSLDGVAGSTSSIDFGYFQSSLATGSVQDYSALRAYDGTIQTIIVTDFPNVSDGVAGVFVCDAADSSSPDDGGLCIVDMLGRRWKRRYVDFISVKWFEKRAGEDDGPAIQRAAQAAFSKKAPLYFPTGTYICSQTLTVPGDSQRWYGANRRTAQIQSSAAIVLTNGTGTNVVNYFCLEHIFLASSAANAKVFDHTYFKYLHTCDIQIEMGGINSSGMYGKGSPEGASPYYNVHLDTMIGAKGVATGCRGIHYEMTQVTPGTVRGPNSNVWIGGRISSCLYSVEVEAGNSNTFTGLQSEAVRADGADFFLGARTPSFTGTATGGTRSTLVDAVANFTGLSNGGIAIVAGTGAGQKRKLHSASGTTASVKTTWEVIPDSTSVYEIYAASAVNNTMSGFRSEGTLAKSAVLKETLGVYQNYMYGGHVSSITNGRLIEQEVYDPSALYLTAGMKPATRFLFCRDAVAAALTNSALSVSGASTQVILETDGEIVGMTAHVSAARTAGLVRIEATVNGVGTGFFMEVDAVNNQDLVKVAAWGAYPIGGRGRRLGTRITTSADWLPTSANLSVELVVLPRN